MFDNMAQMPKAANLKSLLKWQSHINGVAWLTGLLPGQLKNKMIQFYSAKFSKNIQVCSNILLVHDKFCGVGTKLPGFLMCHKCGLVVPIDKMKFSLINAITRKRWVKYCSICRMLYKTISCFQDHMSLTIAELITPNALKNVFGLASNELAVIKEPDFKLIKKFKDKLVFYYGMHDLWAPLDCLRKLRKAVPAVSIMTLIIYII